MDRKKESKLEKERKREIPFTPKGEKGLEESQESTQSKADESLVAYVVAMKATMQP